MLYCIIGAMVVIIVAIVGVAIKGGNGTDTNKKAPEKKSTPQKKKQTPSQTDDDPKPDDDDPKPENPTRKNDRNYDEDRTEAFYPDDTKR